MEVWSKSVKEARKGDGEKMADIVDSEVTERIKQTTPESND